MWFFFMFLVFGIACGFAGFMMLDRFGKETAGALLGVFLGPIGLLIAWIMRSNEATAENQRFRMAELAALRQIRNGGVGPLPTTVETEDSWIIECPSDGPTHQIRIPKQVGIKNAILICPICRKTIDYTTARDIARVA